MGRLFETLRKAENVRIPAATPTTPIETPNLWEEKEDGEESPSSMPFIEVGPKHSMQGSPDVLPPAQPAVKSGWEKVGEATALEPEAAWRVPPIIEEGPAPKPTRPNSRSVRLSTELITYHKPGHARSKRFHELAVKLLMPVPGIPSQVFLFTSALCEAGTTTTLLNLAISSIHAEGMPRRRVLVIDANLKRPGIASRLGIPAGPGLRELIAGQVSLDHAIQETDQLHLYALTAGNDSILSRAAGQGPAYRAETIRSLLRQLRQRFDLILVDGQRWDNQSEIVVLGSVCDSVFVVMPPAEADSSQVDDLFQWIPEQGARLAGCLIAG